MKRKVYLFLVVVAVVLAYIWVFNFLKSNKIQILNDRTNQITKQDDSYLHYKVFDNKLLNDYGIDFRMIIAKDRNINLFAKQEFDKMIKHPRRKAKSFILVVLNKSQDKSILLSKNLKSRFDKKFIQNIKNYKSKNIRTSVIGIIEKFLDHAIKTKN